MPRGSRPGAQRVKEEQDRESIGRCLELSLYVGTTSFLPHGPSFLSSRSQHPHPRPRLRARCGRGVTQSLSCLTFSILVLCSVVCGVVISSPWGGEHRPQIRRFMSFSFGHNETITYSPQPRERRSFTSTHAYNVSTKPSCGLQTVNNWIRSSNFHQFSAPQFLLILRRFS